MGWGLSPFKGMVAPNPFFLSPPLPGVRRAASCDLHPHHGPQNTSESQAEGSKAGGQNKPFLFRSCSVSGVCYGNRKPRRPVDLVLSVHSVNNKDTMITRKRGGGGDSEVTDAALGLTVAVVSWVSDYLQTHRVVYIKYV